MHEYYRIKDAVANVLQPLSFTEESEDSEIDHYGSIQSLFVSGQKKVLLGWDGQGGFGYAEVRLDDTRIPVTSVVHETQQQEFDDAIIRMCEDLKGLVV